MTSTPQTGSLLSARERVVVAGVARGRSNAEIGSDLHISPLTVKSHLQRIRARYGVSTRAGVVGEAYRRGDLRGLAPEPREQLRFGRITLAVLESVGRGLTYPQAAAVRDRTEDTIKSLMYRVLKRLDAVDAAHAVALAYQHGYLPLPQQQAVERAA